MENSNEPNTGVRQSSEGLFSLIQRIEPAPDAPVQSWPKLDVDILDALKTVWSSSIFKSDWMFVPNWFIRKARKYRPKSDFCKRKFKRRSKRK